MSIKYLILCCALLIVQYCSMAQSATLKGRVSEVHKQSPLTGAHVVLLGQEEIAVTDNTGIYQFNSIAYGTYQISVCYIGFTTIVKEIIIDKEINILTYLKV